MLISTMSGLNAENAPVSPGLQVIANNISIVKTGIVGADISFTSDEISQKLGTDISNITVTSLMPREVGILKLGSLEIREGDSISKNNIDHLRFVPTSNTELETCFEFTVGNTYSTKYKYTLFTLDRVNSAPVITQPDSITGGVFSGMSTLGSIQAQDPDGDSFTFEVVTSPKHGNVEFTDSSLGYYVYTPFEAYSGKDSFTVNATDKYGAVSNTVKISLEVDTASESEIFNDMVGHWANSAVIACERAGLINSGENFLPDSPMGRAEFLDMMMNAAGYNGFSSQNTCFADDSDIPEKYKGSVALANALGIVSGIELDGEICFCPNNQITRAEASVIVARLMGLETDSIAISTDDSIPTWAKASMEGLRDVGVIRGKLTNGEISLSPYEVITKASAAQIAFTIMNMS